MLFRIENFMECEIGLVVFIQMNVYVFVFLQYFFV